MQQRRTLGCFLLKSVPTVNLCSSQCSWSEVHGLFANIQQWERGTHKSLPMDTAVHWPEYARRLGASVSTGYRFSGLGIKRSHICTAISSSAAHGANMFTSKYMSKHGTKLINAFLIFTMKNRRWQLLTLIMCLKWPAPRYPLKLITLAVDTNVDNSRGTISNFN